MRTPRSLPKVRHTNVHAAKQVIRPSGLASDANVSAFMELADEWNRNP